MIRNTAASSYPASEAAASVAGSARTAPETSSGDIRARVKSPDAKINFDFSGSTHGGTAKSDDKGKGEKKSKSAKGREKDDKDDESPDDDS